eukprot:scaffold28118_cov94-Skeletonema_dohrnii-CCMP3373.AAC.2
MIRRLNLSKAKPKSTYMKREERYHHHSNDDEFVCEVLCDADDADVIWESLSSLTLQDYVMQSSSMRRSTSFMMLDASPDQITSNSLLNDTIIKGRLVLSLSRISMGLLWLNMLSKPIYNAKNKTNRKLMQARSQLEQKDTFCMACD